MDPMSRLRVVFLTALAAAACARAPHELPVPPGLTVSLDPEVVVGDDPVSRAALLGAPRTVRTDAAGRIYVADVLAMGVKVFDNAGTYLRTIGSRGREPGQFFGIDAIDVDSRGHLLVADGINRRITRFDDQGHVLASQSIDSEVMLWPRAIDELAPGRYLLSYKLPETRKGDLRRYVFHVFDQSFTRPEASFGDIEDYGDPKDPVVDTVSQANPGSFTLTADGAVLYAPSLYRGKVYRYERDGGEWRKTASYQGYVKDPVPFVRVDPQEHDAKTLNLSSTSDKGRLAANFNNESRGLFVLRSGEIVHFTFIAIDDRRVFGMELYDPRGNLQGYGEIASVERPADTGVNLPFYVAWKDAEDRFYLRDETGVPVVRVVSLRWAEQEPVRSAALVR